MKGHEILRREIDTFAGRGSAGCPSDSVGGSNGGGGPPTAGDVNADGIPDIAVAGGVGYAVLDGSRLVDASITDSRMLLLWTQETIDCLAQTSSSVFDLDGDGRAEVLYADEHTFRIYRGETGEVLFETCNTNGTIWEQPVVADVHNDAGRHRRGVERRLSPVPG